MLHLPQGQFGVNVAMVINNQAEKQALFVSTCDMNAR